MSGHLMVIGAHISDAENIAGATMLKHKRAGWSVSIVHVTAGEKGHPTLPADEYLPMRLADAHASAEFIGADLEILPFKDAELQVTDDAVWTVADLIRRYPWGSKSLSAAHSSVKRPASSCDADPWKAQKSIDGKNEKPDAESGSIDNPSSICYAALERSCRKSSAACLAMKTSGRIHAIGRARSTPLSIFNTHLVYPAAIQRDYLLSGFVYTRCPVLERVTWSTGTITRVIFLNILYTCGISSAARIQLSQAASSPRLISGDYGESSAMAVTSFVS